MDLKTFLGEFIEGALFMDLDTMAVAKPSATASTPKYGYLGYPMIMTAAAGIELLGILVADRYEERSQKNFKRYWKNYLYPSGPKRDVAEAVYSLARCGITHNYAGKAPTISKSGEHLVRVGDIVQIDAVQLATDLKESYFRQIRPIVDGTPSGDVTAKTMAKRLDDMLKAHNKEYKEHKAAFDALDAAAARPATTVASTATSLAVPPTGSAIASSIPTIMTTSSPK
ncbi:MAG TPA: hypothetical protein VMJ10_36795 [Kofleriaceae bacterium]|nr:hypothetical protein [Kofleriaceae bacterium]